MPPGKKWPTLRVRITTSTRTDSPRRTATSCRSSGASTSAGGAPVEMPAAPKRIDSSPTANVLDRRGSAVPRASASSGGGASATRVMPKTSTEICPSRRKSCTSRSCSSSPLTKGSAVLAPGKRCERTRPSRAAGSSDGTSGMWQSRQVWGAGG